jgi:hypothetical protein
MRTFTMFRRWDISDTHDENQANPPDQPQFEGVEFTDGRVAIRWLTPKPATSVWDSMEDMLAVHGHPEYGSELIWIEDRERSVTENCTLADPQRADCQYDVLGYETGMCFCEYECERRARGLEVVEPEAEE